MDRSVNREKQLYLGIAREQILELYNSADSDKNRPLVLFNNIVKNDFYLEGVKPEMRKEIVNMRENANLSDVCKTATVAVYVKRNKEKIETSKKVSISVLEDLDNLDVFE